MKVNLDVGEIKGLKTPALDPKGSSLSAFTKGLLEHKA